MFKNVQTSSEKVFSKNRAISTATERTETIAWPPAKCTYIYNSLCSVVLGMKVHYVGGHTLVCFPCGSLNNTVFVFKNISLLANNCFLWKCVIKLQIWTIASHAHHEWVSILWVNSIFYIYLQKTSRRHPPPTTYMVIIDTSEQVCKLCFVISWIAQNHEALIICKGKAGATGVARATQISTKSNGRMLQLTYKYYSIYIYIYIYIYIPRLVHLVKCRGQHCVLALYLLLLKVGKVSGHIHGCKVCFRN